MAELSKLKNQIRLELNKVRPTRELAHFENKPTFKKMYPPRNKTNITDPREDKSLDAKKRYYNVDAIFHEDSCKKIERKHFQKQYVDRVRI